MQVGLLYCHTVAFKSKTAAAMAAQTLRDAKLEALGNDDEAFGFDGTYV